ncbi:uncharacterized protein LOC113145275 isoform X3 [Mastacembelus armatus]|uniref:uncharacterized protein LOC113145275 isoform X3 n=1 Tax=Mastacembelus armatus TaxID=205130 RepID=UPI000E45791A|nr:uncharacterized protein LOC113145275 isoform X3 [Mastacembelus armatus]
MPSEDKPPQQTRQRKKNKKSRSKGKSSGGSPSAQLGDSFDQHDDLILPPVHLPPKKPVEEKPKVSVAKVEESSSIAICLQVLFPYLLAGMGMVMAGMVLDSVQAQGQETVSETFDAEIAKTPNCAPSTSSALKTQDSFAHEGLCPLMKARKKSSLVDNPDADEHTTPTSLVLSNLDCEGFSPSFGSDSSHSSKDRDYVPRLRRTRSIQRMCIWTVTLEKWKTQTHKRAR